MKNKETLEEAKERYLDSPTPHSYRLAVEFGAKWQQEKISKLRDELFAQLPIGNINDFDLIKIINCHIQKLDELI